MITNQSRTINEERPVRARKTLMSVANEFFENLFCRSRTTREIEIFKFIEINSQPFIDSNVEENCIKLMKESFANEIHTEGKIKIICIDHEQFREIELHHCCEQGPGDSVKKPTSTTPP